MGDGQIWVNKIRGKIHKSIIPYSIKGINKGINTGIKKELTKKKRASSVYTRVQRGLYFPSEKTGLRI
jgi:hypothetical protein